MKLDSTVLMLGQNAFQKIGNVAMKKYFPPFQMILRKHGGKQNPLIIGDTPHKGKLKVDMFSKGVYLYKSRLFAYALPYFKLYSWSYPDSVYGHLWTSRIYNIKSQPGVNMDAVDSYKQAWNILVKDSARLSYKQIIVEVAGYLSAYEFLINFNLANALWYLKQAYAMNPSSVRLSDAIRRLEGLGATGKKASFKHEDFRPETF